MDQFSQVYNRVMAFDYRQNFISTQYLENKLMELDQIFHALMFTRSLLV